MTTPKNPNAGRDILRASGQVAIRLKSAKAKAAKQERVKEVPSEMPAWMNGDRAGLPMKPPGKEGT